MTASEPTDLVLQVRLDSLGRCLAGVSQIKEGLARQQEGLESLKALLDKNAPLRVAARVISVDLPGWIAKLYDAHDIPEDPNLDPTKTQLTATAPTIMDDLRQAEKILNEIPTIQVPDEVLDLLAGPAGELAKTIETGVSQLEAAHRDQATDQDQSSDAVAAVWASVWDNQQRIRNVFSEYVDLLGGLALRSGGFGRNVFELADELIETLAVGSKVYWRSLTIPASAEKTEKTLAYMIRLGFPEWTIWALPLAAYGLGYVVIESRPDLHQNVGSIPGDPFGRDHVSSLLADVFATYTLGPAYVCANLLLRLNPFGAALVADRLRAAVLLATLEWMNSDHGEGTAGPFADVISKRPCRAFSMVTVHPFERGKKHSGPQPVGHQGGPEGVQPEQQVGAYIGRPKCVCREHVGEETADVVSPEGVARDGTDILVQVRPALDDDVAEAVGSKRQSPDRPLGETEANHVGQGFFCLLGRRGDGERPPIYLGSNRQGFNQLIRQLEHVPAEASASQGQSPEEVDVLREHVADALLVVPYARPDGGNGVG